MEITARLSATENSLAATRSDLEASTARVRGLEQDVSIAHADLDAAASGNRDLTSQLADSTAYGPIACCIMNSEPLLHVISASTVVLLDFLALRLRRAHEEEACTAALRGEVKELEASVSAAAVCICNLH